MNFQAREICDRLRILRLQAFGPRGKARFAKRLGIRASSYQQYEATRIPPVDLLIRAAAIGQCDLLWLLVGDAAGKPTADPEADGAEASGEHPVIARVRELLDRRPETAQSLSAFLTLIDPTGPPSTDPAGRTSPEKETFLTSPTNEMVPVVGSTAAGPARFWRELLDDRHRGEPWGDEANVRLERLLEEWSQRARSTDGRLLRDTSDPEPDSTAALIQFSRPDELGLIEFLSCPGLDQTPSRLIAWRIDGDSMMPRYRDGDFVLVSPDQPAAEGSPCVAHQRGQIGVNCKIFKRDGTDVVLIPVNEVFSPQRFPASELVWAHCVLYSVRLKPHQVR
jgi:Peptidase S24-like